MLWRRGRVTDSRTGPTRRCRKSPPGAYTAWEDGRLVYVGMSGRGLAEDIAAPDEPTKAKGLWTRRDSDPSGRRSGDKFCVYVCDRFVVPRLSPQQQTQVGDGVLSLDALTREYIRDRFEYRHVTVDNGRDALALERDAQRGAMSVGKPFLNPL